MINQNVLSISPRAQLCMNKSKVAFDGMVYTNPGYGDDANGLMALIAWFLSIAKKVWTKYNGGHWSTLHCDAISMNPPGTCIAFTLSFIGSVPLQAGCILDHTIATTVMDSCTKMELFPFCFMGPTLG